MRPLLAAASLSLLGLAGPPALAEDSKPIKAHGDCTVTAGPRDRVAVDHDLVIPAGAEVEEAVAMRGNLVLERGARVKKASAVGGTLTLRPGAVVAGEAVSIGGDVVLEGDARVEGNAVSLGGQVRIAPGAKVGGEVTSLSLQLGGQSLARSVLDGLKAQGPCRVVAEAR
jgi:cytoskeletal protein CcmA (bactofilin family)